MPTVLGYLLTGLLVSPFTPGFVADENQLALLADIGVVLLLFEVGVEIDLRRMRREQKSILWGVPAQMAVGILLGTPVFLWLGIPIFGALLLSLSVAMSSSVVIVNIVRSPRRRTDSSTEDALLGWTVVQDVVCVTLAIIILTIFGESDRPLPIELLGSLVLQLLHIYLQGFFQNCYGQFAGRMIYS